MAMLMAMPSFAGAKKKAEKIARDEEIRRKKKEVMNKR